jgi:hypothetical protein
LNAILTNDDLRRIVPSAFATTPYDAMSKSYRFIPTSEVLDMMTGLGFSVVKASQSRTRIPGKKDFTRHMLRLRHSSFMGESGEVPEVVLLNSHDRSSAYKLYTGIMRFVCENGMIVQAADFGSFSIRHSGSRDLYAQITEATNRIMDNVPTIMGRIADWREIILPRPVQSDFAERAMDLKPNPSVKPVSLLTARRVEDYTQPDASRDLWTTLNVIQENLIRGGVSGQNERGRKIKTRPVKAVAADVAINRKLWELAETFSHN